MTQYIVFALITVVMAVLIYSATNRSESCTGISAAYGECEH